MATTKDTNEPNKFFSLVPRASKPNLLAQVTKLCISVLCACNYRATVLVYVNVANLTLHGLIQRDNRGICFILGRRIKAPQNQCCFDLRRLHVRCCQHSSIIDMDNCKVALAGPVEVEKTIPCS